MITRTSIWIIGTLVAVVALLALAAPMLRGVAKPDRPSFAGPEVEAAGAKWAVEILYRSELGDEDKIAGRVADYEDRFANPFVAAEKGFIDEVIMPHNTRKRVSRAFASLRGKKLENPWKKHDNIPL